MIEASSHWFSVSGRRGARSTDEAIRVVVAGDVLALPDEGWSCGNFGTSVSAHWLLTSARPPLPGTKARRELLADCLSRALTDHYDLDRGSPSAAVAR